MSTIREEMVLNERLATTIKQAFFSGEDWDKVVNDVKDKLQEFHKIARPMFSYLDYTAYLQQVIKFNAHDVRELIEDFEDFTDESTSKEHEGGK